MKNNAYVRVKFLSAREGLELNTSQMVLSNSPLDGDDLDRAFAHLCLEQKKKKPIILDHDTQEVKYSK